MLTPETKIHCVANIFIREMYFRDIGSVEVGHSHPYPHITLLAFGSLKVTIGDQETVFNAPKAIYIEPETQHTLTSMAAKTIAYCIHGLRGENGDIVDPESIPNGSVISKEMMARIVTA